jgi:hypothetical protein
MTITDPLADAPMSNAQILEALALRKGAKTGAARFLTNAGLIPMEAVTTMGVSAKEGENPIGFFGTGLKYAIASLLRTSHKITIWRGLDRYDFATEPARFAARSSTSSA